ncbi:MAG: hypothetical protein K2X94_00010 [Amoebophilaceae bacterium]|nr:hypothetical protein [Amoebophilaceae bacterium]
MKKIFSNVILGAFAVCLSQVAVALETITVAATQTPNGDLLNMIKPILAKQGYVLEIKNYTSYNDPGVRLISSNNPNLDVENKTCDVNFFQHVPYLNEYNKSFDTDLVSVGKVFYIPYQIYPNKLTQSKLIKSHHVNDITENATVGIPDNEINGARALKLLAAAKLIMLKPNVTMPEIDDIVRNPHHIVITKIDSAVLGQMLENNKVDFVVMNSQQAKLERVDTANSFFIENQNSTYANILVSRKDNLNSPKVQALYDALTSDEAKHLIQTKFTGIAPSF